MGVRLRERDDGVQVNSLAPHMSNYRDVKIVPGLYKIFDEILVNAADNKIRDPNMDSIKVNVDRENGTISIWNNGRGIPIEVHEVFLPVIRV